MAPRADRKVRPQPAAEPQSGPFSHGNAHVTVAESKTLTVSFHRGAVLESTHRVHAAVSDATGRVVRSWGDPGRITLLRSAAKPFQALPLVEDGAADHFGLSEEEIALCCGSHNSEEAHLAVARSILAKAALEEDLLVCGPHAPLLRERDLAMAAEGVSRSAIVNNCSGKHAGMLALAAFHGWPLLGYQLPDHPVQLRMLHEVARWTGAAPESMQWGVDGCGVVSFAVSVAALACGTAGFASAAARGEAPRRVVRAMTRHPFMVAGTGRLCTRLMQEEQGRVFAKVGTEGVYMAGDLESGLGVALKVEDGAWRAAPPALLAVLDRAGILSRRAASALEEFADPTVTNTLGDRVGHVVVRECS